LRAQLLQMLYSIRSERLLMEEVDYSLRFRWFVGLNAADEVWDATTFSKNRDRLLEAEVAKEFLAHVVGQARTQGLTSDEHFTVDGTLLEAWASLKSFQPTTRHTSVPNYVGPFIDNHPTFAAVKDLQAGGAHLFWGTALSRTQGSRVLEPVSQIPHNGAAVKTSFHTLARRAFHDQKGPLFPVNSECLAMLLSF
jgi:Transposase domain (DUF772)